MRYLIQNLAIVRKLYPNMLLLGKGFYRIESACDPETVLWENLGTPIEQVALKWAQMGVWSSLVLVVSYFGIYFIHYFEVLHN